MTFGVERDGDRDLRAQAAAQRAQPVDGLADLLGPLPAPNFSAHQSASTGFSATRCSSSAQASPSFSDRFGSATQIVVSAGARSRRRGGGALAVDGERLVELAPERRQRHDPLAVVGRVAAPAELALERGAAELAVGGVLVAGAEHREPGALLHVHFAVEHRDARAAHAVVDREDGADDRDGHLVGRDVEVAKLLLRRLDDHLAAVNLDHDAVGATRELELGALGELDLGAVGEHEHRARAARRAHGVAALDRGAGLERRGASGVDEQQLAVDRLDLRGGVGTDQTETAGDEDARGERRGDDAGGERPPRNDEARSRPARRRPRSASRLSSPR